MITINITDAGPKGALTHHVQTHWEDFIFDGDKQTLSVPVAFGETLYFKGVKVTAISAREIALEGTEIVPSGQGFLGPLRQISITFH